MKGGYFVMTLGDPNDREATWELRTTGDFWPSTRKAALAESIKKWEALVAFHHQVGSVKVEKIDAATCALCQLYMDKKTEDCGRCPIKKFTGEDQCWSTPFYRYRNRPNEANAQAMLDFVRSVALATYPDDFEPGETPAPEPLVRMP